MAFFGVVGMAQENPDPDSDSNTEGEDTRTTVYVGELKERKHAKTAIKVKGEVAPYLRATILNNAQDIQRAFFRALKIEAEEWQIPLDILVFGDPTAVLDGRDLAREIKPTPHGLRQILYVKLHDSFRSVDFEREVLRMMIQHEMLVPHLANSDELGEEIVVPQWLLIGFQEHLEYLRIRHRSEIFMGILEGGEMMDISEMLNVKDAQQLDPMSRAMFEASSAALVKTLLDQPDGHESVRSMLQWMTTDTLIEGGNPITPLKQHFPQLRESEMALEKWWTLQIAVLAEKTPFDYHSVEVTQFLLDELGNVIFLNDPTKLPDTAPEEETGRRGVLKKWFPKLRSSKVNEAPKLPGKAEKFALENFREFAKRDDLAEALKRNLGICSEIEHRGFPAYAVLGAHYRGLFTDLEAGQTKSLDADLKKLVELRGLIDDAMEQISDYMNFYEATSAPIKGGVFEDYRQLSRRQKFESPPPRSDRITKYLDELEREFD